MPLDRWLRRHLRPLATRLTTADIRHALGKEAEQAFEFAGYELLETLLVNLAATDSCCRAFIDGGVVELVENFHTTSEARHGIDTRRETLASCRTERDVAPIVPASLAEAVEAALHFYLLARTALEKARLGGPQQVADIALFETYRLAAIGAFESGHIDGSEGALLTQIMRWHHTFDVSNSQDTTRRLLFAIDELRAEAAQFANHSIVLRVVRATPTIHQRVSACALQLISTTVRLDGLTVAEAKTISSFTSETLNAGLEADMSLIRNSLVIAPRRRRGPVPHDEEFDKLWALYRRLVPWSTSDGRAE